jgi:1-acyl-sn-glycerol-3-phosphate acyltransferase
LTAGRGDGPARPRPDHTPPGRVSPEALARSRGDAREGLDWLGRQPEAGATLQYRAARILARLVLFGFFRFRIRVEGREQLPRGGYLLIGAAHRGWMDPFLVLHALPAVPRAWFLGSAASTFRSRWRERLIRWIGGLLPVWRGGIGIDQHTQAAEAVLQSGGVFVQMPEGTVSGPVGRIGAFRTGAALIALRTGAPIVPLAMVGTEELYLGRRMAARIMPPTSASALLGETWDGVFAKPGSRAELDLAHRLSGCLADLLGPVVEELHPWTVDPADHPRRFRRRLTWLFLAPGRLDR